MAACPHSYGQFAFPPGPPLTDAPVATLEAKYLFLPYGTLLEKEESIRLWTEAGLTKTVVIEEKWFLRATGDQLEAHDPSVVIPWQLVALDSGMAEKDLLHWPLHPLHNPASEPVVLVFAHPIEFRPTLKMRWLGFLYWMRTLGR